MTIKSQDVIFPSVSNESINEYFMCRYSRDLKENGFWISKKACEIFRNQHKLAMGVSKENGLYLVTWEEMNAMDRSWTAAYSRCIRFGGLSEDAISRIQDKDIREHAMTCFDGSNSTSVRVKQDTVRFIYSDPYFSPETVKSAYQDEDKAGTTINLQQSQVESTHIAAGKINVVNGYKYFCKDFKRALIHPHRVNF